ncbi:hypothetical protein [Thiolapillus sp.]
MRYGKSLIARILPGVFLLALAACGDDGVKQEAVPLPQLSPEQVRALAGRTFYFAHQSVGYNIIEGVEKVLARMGMPGLFTVRELKPGEPVPRASLLHSTIGSNGDPASKMEEFQSFLEERLGDSRPDLAMLKFCYVDIGRETDVSALAGEYTDTMSRLQAEFPQTVFLYSTVPLRVFDNSIKARLKRLLGMEVWGDRANIKRNEYNEMIRSRFSASGHLADVADWESRFPDGREYRVKVLGGEYAALVPAYTDDGKHLNAYGQQVVAGRLLMFLAGLVQPGSDEAGND